MESCWIEIVRKKQKNIVIGCIYRHPSYETTNVCEILRDQLSNLNDKGKYVLFLGDININLMKYNVDNKTSDYLDMLLNTRFIPLITKPTRITHHTSTLIDHIYTNVPQQIYKSGICLADITDHLPIFCSVTSKLPTFKEEKYFRDFTKFNEVLFIEEIEAVDFSKPH
jgi:hypothetical protein